MSKVYEISDIRRLVKPIAERYGVERVALFGSYARGEATDQSDIDLHIDSGTLHGYFKLAGFHRELEERLGTGVDVLTTGALSDEFLASIANEEVVLYEQ
jgi:predicted nucleotidyltransferase